MAVRESSVVLLLGLVGCACGETSSTLDASARADAASTDDAASDLDASREDAPSAIDAVVATDAALPACEASPGPLVVASGHQLEGVVSGAPLDQPLGLTFDGDGALYIANSHSLLNGSALRGEILRLEDDGSLSTFIDDARLVGPGWIAFEPGGASEPGTGYFGTEDADEAGRVAGDQLLVFDGTTVTDGPDTAEVGRVEFGPGGGFGDDLYFSGRTFVGDVMPNPAVLLRWDPHGTEAPSVVEITGTPALAGLNGFAFANGGALGTDLYVSTLLDTPFTEGTGVGIWRVTPALAATRLVADVVVLDLIATPSTGAFGDALYAFEAVSGAGRIVRVEPDGTTSNVLEGLGRAGAVEFGPDGLLYVSDAGGANVVRLSRCTP